MIIVRKSNFDFDGPRGDQRVVARDIAREYEAKTMCAALNEAEGPTGDDFFVVEPDDYKLPPPWEP